MKAHQHIWAAAGLAAALVFGAALILTARAEVHDTFHVVGHLKLPAAKVRNDFHHLHVSETNGHRFVTVSDSNNVMTIVDVTDRAQPTLARQVRLPAALRHGDAVTLIGGVALVSEGTGKPEIPEVRTVSIVDLSSHKDGNITARFDNVTGLDVDATDIYLISGDDLWILGGREQYASFSSR